MLLNLKSDFFSSQKGDHGKSLVSEPILGIGAKHPMSHIITIKPSLLRRLGSSQSRCWHFCSLCRDASTLTGVSFASSHGETAE